MDVEFVPAEATFNVRLFFNCEADEFTKKELKRKLEEMIEEDDNFDTCLVNDIKFLHYH